MRNLKLCSITHLTAKLVRLLVTNYLSGEYLAKASQLNSVSRAVIWKHRCYSDSAEDDMK